VSCIDSEDFCGPGGRRVHVRRAPSRCRSRISGRLELDEGFHHRTQRSLRRNVGVGVTVVAHRRVSATYVTGAATFAIYVLLPRTSVTQTTSRVFPVGESDADSPDSGGCVPPALSLPSWRAAPCGSVPIVFRERRRHATYPHHPGPARGHRCGRGHGRPHPPRRGLSFRWRAARALSSPRSTKPTAPQLRTPSLASEISKMRTRFGMRISHCSAGH
jgi:hypothetical protein